MYDWPVTTTTTPDLTRLTRQFQALTDETRLQVIDMLRAGEQCVCELQGALGSAQSRLSFHLRVLKDAGLVSDRREGRWSYYRLNPDAFEQLEAFVGGLPRTRLTVLASRCCG
jgi:ArsR family transcriptional regulator